VQLRCLNSRKAENHIAKMFSADLWSRIVANRHFKDVFCERFGIPQSKYEKRALRELLFPHARLVVSLLRKVVPSCWKEDLKFVRHLGDAEDFQEAEATLSEFRGANRWSRSFWRNRCKLRVSGRKAGKLARELFSTAPVSEKA